MDYAEVVFEESAPTKSGVTAADEMEQVRLTVEALGLDWKIEESVANEHPELGIPPGLDFIWETFLEFSGQRRQGEGPCPLMWSDVQAWCWLFSVRLSHFELDVIRRLDRLWMKVMGEAYARLSTTQPRDSVGPSGQSQ